MRSRISLETAGSHTLAASPRIQLIALLAVRIKNNAMRGSRIENVFARNLEIGQVAEAALAIINGRVIDGL